MGIEILKSTRLASAFVRIVDRTDVKKAGRDFRTRGKQTAAPVHLLGRVRGCWLGLPMADRDYAE